MHEAEPVDVVIVGAGMGGAAFAWQLTRRAPGLRVLCLERGGWADPAAFPTAGADWQMSALGAWSASPNVRLAAGGNPWSADYAVDDSASPLKPLMWSGVGGSTINWSAHFPRLHPSDFRVASLDGVAADWPLGYTDLEPWYDLNDRMMGVSGLAGDPAYPPKPERAFPPLAMGRAGAVAARGFDALGWHWWPVDAAILTRPHGGRGACNHCGPCSQGCLPRAKASADVTYWPGAAAQGAALATHATVTAIETAAGRAGAVIWRGPDGRETRQPAAAIVLAGNGIGTARLLLASGLGGPAAGRNLMMHPVAYVRGIFREALDGPVGPVGCSIYSHEFYETDRARGFVRGVQLQVTRENSLLLQSLRTVPNWGREAQRQVAEEFRHSLAILVMTEDLPEPENRVTLGAGMAPDGLPPVRMAYRPSANTDAMLTFGMDRAEDVLRAAGAVRTVRVPYPPLTGWHLLGTAAMGADPATSVTDAAGRVHGAPGVLVCDGSLFPTAGAVNPGSTIGALALMLADRLAEEMR